MKTTKEFKKFVSEITLGIFLVTSLNPVPAFAITGDSEISYPLKEVSKLECRYDEFSELSSNCKEDLPILNTKDYTKYATKDWGYNDYTRRYTVLWWSSYKYWWDVWNGWHMWVDIATSKWTPVYSVAEWIVINAKELIALWNNVTIKHSINWKTVVSSYSHLSKINVNLWDKITMWEKIWEVWSTWNSTWNHLHFQIDLENNYYPSYYDYKSCPYSYYEISENWVCFNELKKLTIDPLLFLETNWNILNNIKTTTVSRDNFKQEPSVTTNSNEIDLNIFDKTVYIWYPINDIKEVQKIFSKLWYYNWEVNWNYNDLIDDIINYQLKTNIISSENDDWAGRFGPKTRVQAKNDYTNLDNKVLATTNTSSTATVTNTNTSNDTTNIETQKISRETLLTREEIEAREVSDFIKKYNIKLQFVNPGWNIEIGWNETLKLEILNKNWKPFKWNMPWWMTFIVDEAKVSVFPKKLYYFTDWKRDIILTWINTWDTNLYIKIWNETIKTIPIKIFKTWQEIKPEKSIIIWTDQIILWDKKTWIIVFKDKNWKKLINISYDANIKLQASEDMQICVKPWNIKSIKNIYTTKCSDEQFVKYKNITYKDTVWWLLIFDYKVSWKNANLDIFNNETNKSLSSKKIIVSNPKWLSTNYEYKNEVVEMLEKWVVDWINKWYFLENRELKEYDALSWIRNSLINMNEDPQFFSKKPQIETNLRNVFEKRKDASHYDSISRKELLDFTYEYLIFDKSNTWITRKYIDLEDSDNLIVNKIFDQNTTWKDQFWEKYFRPDVLVTRWEWAYIFSNVIEKNEKQYLTRK